MPELTEEQRKIIIRRLGYRCHTCNRIVSERLDSPWAARIIETPEGTKLKCEIENCEAAKR